MNERLESKSEILMTCAPCQGLWVALHCVGRRLIDEGGEIVLTRSSYYIGKNEKQFIKQNFMFNGGGEIVLMRLQKLFDNNFETQLIKSCVIVFLKIGREIFHVLGGIFEKKVR